MRAVSTACLACHLLRDTPLREPVWVPPPSFPPGEAAAWLLPTVPSAVAEVRAACRSVLCAWGLEDTVDSACLVMTELVTNAIQHGQGPVHVLVASHRNELTIEVYDAGDDLPEVREAGFDMASEGGRGLPLVVGTLARCWTVTRVTPAGKIVAAVLPRQRTDADDADQAYPRHSGKRLPARSVLGLLPQEWLATDASAGTGVGGCEQGCGADVDTVSAVEPAHGAFQLLPARPSGWSAWDPEMSHKP